MQLNKRTPCVGICSTTYGDLVCRGCKRFAHEIVQWNGYDETQQDAVRERLTRLRDEILEALLVCEEPSLLQAALSEAGLTDFAQKEGLYQLLRFMVRREQSLAIAGLALSAGAIAQPEPSNQPTPELDTLHAMQLLDAESYRRAKAHYERNFKVPA
ncbi:MAG: DUF1289 domain-containing protein [Pseudomonadota bacterium]|nr:DUF1289 domain-containing protein [Pseudomonadota bacterium]MEC8619997.1 DUF1289 domain-containing protein [Pseudomonadota bacterium]